MSKAKAQGTRHESWLVKALAAAGHTARRLAEGGKDDEGDVEVTLHDRRWVMEAKARQSLNVQATLGAARRKAKAVAGEDVPVAVVWKRLVPVLGKKVRQPVAGERVVISMSMEDFETLLTDAYASGFHDAVDNQPQCLAVDCEAVTVGDVGTGHSGKPQLKQV